MGAKYDVTVDDVRLSTTISSGISQKSGAPLGVYLDKEFEIASGIGAKLTAYCSNYNFGYGDVIFGASTPDIQLSLVREGRSSVWDFGFHW